MLATVPAAVKRWGFYLLKSAVLIVMLYLFAQHAGALPPWGIAAVWAVLSAVSAVGFTYYRVVSKTLKQYALVEGGGLARLNNGRMVCLVVSFVLSAVCVAGLMLEMPKWGALEWAALAVAAVGYVGVLALVQRLLRGEYAPAFRVAKATRASVLITTALLCVAYFVLGSVQPAAEPASAAEAFALVRQPFEGSPSALAAEAGLLASLVDGFALYGAAQAAGVSTAGYAAVKIALVFSAYCGAVGLLGMCSLEWRELRRVFLPLEAGTAPKSKRPLVKRNVVVAAVLPVVLAVGFMVADGAVAKAAQTQEYTVAQRFVRDQVDLAVYVLDGKYYEQRAVNALLEEAQLEAASLAADAEAVLVPLINASFDARVTNVDGYLDWYYSLPGDYERLVTMVTGTVEEYVQGKFDEAIGAGVDDTELEAQLLFYWEQAEGLKSGVLAELANYEVVGVPVWLMSESGELTASQLDELFEPTQGIAQLAGRLGLSTAAGVGAGIGTGFVTKHLVEKAAKSEFVKLAIEKIGQKLLGRGVGAVAGGAIGAIGGPVGVVAGALVGGAASVGVDYGLLKLDEAWNRETYKAELVQVIEDARAEMLADVRGAA